MNRTLAALVVVALWLGAALLTAAVVAPGAFAVLPTRMAAGAMVGRVLPVVFFGTILVPVVALGLAPAIRRSGAARLFSLLSALSAAAALLIVNPRIASLREVVVVSIDQLAPADPRRALFGALHAGSVALLGLAMLAMTALLVLIARTAAGRAPSSGDVR